MELFCGSQMFEMFMEQRKKNIFQSSAFEKRVSMDKLQSNLKHLIIQKEKGGTKQKKILGSIIPSFGKSKKSHAKEADEFSISSPTFVASKKKDNNNNK